MKFVFVLFVFLFSYVELQAQPKNSPRIIGGQTLQSHELSMVQRLGSYCTASLIGPKVIVTAAHCIWYNAGFFFVEGSSPVYIQKFIINPDYIGTDNLPYDFAFKNDQAVGILEVEIFDMTPLTISTTAPSLAESLLLVGTGLPSSGVRQYGYMNVELISDIGFSLTGAQNSVALDSGDSGGPALLKTPSGAWQLIGINSTSSREYDQFGVKAYTSGISRINSASGIQFLKNVAAKENVEICGINAHCDEVTFN